jgi:alginate O-acetyltransferase complex protein AlgJ
MENRNNISVIKYYYSWGFVILLLISLSSAMFLSIKQGYIQFNGNFYQKDLLIGSFSRLRMKLGDRVFSVALIEKNGWLELNSTKNLDDFQNITRTPPHVLVNIQQKLNALNEQLKKRNIVLIVVIAPNKATIYPENVPVEIKKIGEKSRLDSFLDLVKKNNSQMLIDLRPALMDGKKYQQIYYKTDTHWNLLGAYIAYREIMNKLSITFTDLKPFAMTDFLIKEKKPEILDLSTTLKTNLLVESKIIFKPNFTTDAYIQHFPDDVNSSLSMSWVNNEDQNKTLLMYHDSFGVPLQSLFQYHFEQATYIQLDANLITIPWIERYHPDVVIIEIVERNLDNLEFFLSNN